VVAAVVGLATIDAWAEELPDQWAFRAGGFFVRNYETTLRLDSTGLPLGTTVDFGDTLGGDSTANVFRLDGYYRFNPRHRMDMSYYRIERKGSRAIDAEIRWGDEIFVVNDVIATEIDSGVLKLGYTYSFYHNDDVELGLSAGLHASILRASMSDSSGVAEAESVTAPLPVFGFLVEYHIKPRWTAKVASEFFFIDVFGIRGALTDSLIVTEYRFTRHLGAGIGLNHFGNALQFEGDNLVLSMRGAFTGLLAYLSASF
jgi:hypothetical protein